MQYSAVETTGVPGVEARWYTNSGMPSKSTFVGAFACFTKPRVLDSKGPAKGWCSSKGRQSHAIYRDPALEYAVNPVNVVLLDTGVDLTYHVTFKESGTPAKIFRY